MNRRTEGTTKMPMNAADSPEVIRAVGVYKAHYAARYYTDRMVAVETAVMDALDDDQFAAFMELTLQYDQMMNEEEA